MSKALRNDLFRAVQAGGLNPAECDLVRMKETDQERISHPRSGSSITFGTVRPGQYMMDSTVGTDDTRRPELEYGPNWTDVLASIRVWAARVKEWDDVPDLWLMLTPDGDVAYERPENQDDNRPFTIAEQDEIAQLLAAIKRNLKETYSLTAGQMASIERRLDEAVEASTRLGRKDWKLLLYGTALGLFANDLVPAAPVQHMLSMALQSVAHIFGHGLPPLLPPQA